MAPANVARKDMSSDESDDDDDDDDDGDDDILPNHSIIRRLREELEAAKTGTATATAAAEAAKAELATMRALVQEKEQEMARMRAQSGTQVQVSTPSVQHSPFRSTAAVEEQKVDNIRKTYATIKRRFDMLHSVAVNLSTCTRSMEASTFGEFGQYLRQLRAVLEEDGGG